MTRWYMKSFSVYLDPDFEECIELAKSGWDTIRVLEEDDHIVMASGYGNTHSSCQHFATAEFGRYWRGACFIIFREDQDFWFNLEDVSGNRKVHYLRALRLFSDKHQALIRDVIIAS